MSTNKADGGDVYKKFISLDLHFPATDYPPGNDPHHHHCCPKWKTFPQSNGYNRRI